MARRSQARALAVVASLLRYWHDTGYLLGKGAKERSIPLPRQCADVLRSYRLARGLPAAPHALERVPLIHGDKGMSLGARGLYDEVKGVFLDVADQIGTEQPDDAALLRAASPHWLRHAYARTLVVDRLVPLPAAQTLLGHASVQTTAEYAKTDLAKLREFVEMGFGRGSARSGPVSNSQESLVPPRRT